MKTHTTFFQKTSEKTRITFSSAFSYLVILFLLLFAVSPLFQIGQAREFPRRGNSAAPDFASAPTTLVSNRCSAYSAPLVPAPLNTFYINADSGNDSNDGRTPATGWKTLSKANVSARAGDLFLLRGVFANQWISPNASGTTASKIVYRKEPGQTAVLENGFYEGGVFLDGKSHIVVDGLEIRNITYPVQVTNGGSYNWLRNLYVHNAGSVTFRFGANNNRLEDSVMNDIGSDQANSGDSVSLLGDADDNTVVRNYFGNAGHGAYDDTVQGNSVGFNERNIVAQNIFDNQWANNVILGGRSGSAEGGTLLECNVMKNASQATQYNYPRGGLYVNGDNNIVRYNYIYNNKSVGIQVQGYVFAGQDQFPENNQFYHNTIAGNGSAGLYIAAGGNGYVRNNTFENNIFWNNFGSDGANGSRYEIAADFYQSSVPWTAGFTDGNIFRYNNVSSISKFFIVVRHSSGGGNIYYDTPAAAQTQLPSWTNNSQTNPLFTNEGGGDYSLQTSSSLINAGRLIPGVIYNGSAPDKGAFETGASPTPTPSPSPTVSPTATPTPMVTPTPTGNQFPYNGVAPIAPAVIEAENFDNGGEGVAYHDIDAGNNGGVYRTSESVDIRANSTASNENDVFNAAAGEWTEYTFRVSGAGLYDIGVAYASALADGKFHIEVDGVNVTGQLVASPTGSWWSYKQIGKSGVQLSAGTHILRLTQDSNATGYQVVANFDKIYIFKKRALMDFDGDGKTDVSVFRPSQAMWYENRSLQGYQATQLGISTDKLVPADYDGDGKTDVAVFRDGNWYRLNSGDGQFVALQFGATGDLPVAGDFDGDGKADLAVFRPSNGVWYRLNSSNGQFVAVQFGANGDKPQVADFDADGKTDLAVFRPSNGGWYYLRSSDGTFVGTNFGQSGDIAAAADFDGDGKADLAVFRPSSGSWYRISSGSNQFVAVQFGANGDIPVPADYDGDGKADIAVFRPANGTWYLLRSTAGFTGVEFGSNGDVPTPSAFGQ